MVLHDRRYLNAYTPMGMRQFDPKMIYQVKKIITQQPTVLKQGRRFLSDRPENYQG